MVADRVEEPVRVGDDARRRQRDHLVEARRRLERQFRHETLIDVRVRGRIALEQILRVADDLDGGGRAFESERQIDCDGNTTTHVDVPLERLEALRGDRHVIRIRRQIGEHVLAGRVGRRRPGEAGDRVADLDLDGLHDAAGRILDCALHRTRAAEPLGARARDPDCTHRDRDLESHRHNVETPPRQHTTSFPEALNTAGTLSRHPGRDDQNRLNGRFQPANVSVRPVSGREEAAGWRADPGGSPLALQLENGPSVRFAFQRRGDET